MPIDPSIALQVKPIQLDNPLELRAKLQAQQLNSLQLGQAQREEDYQRTLGDLVRTNAAPDGTVNQKGVMQGLAQNGLGARLPGYQKQLLEAETAQAGLRKTNAEIGKAGAETDASKFKLSRDRQEAANGVLASLLSRPNINHDDVIQSMQDLVSRGYYTPEEGAAAVRALPGRPEDLRGFLMQKGIEGVEAAKRMELLAPKFQSVDAGGTTQLGTVAPLTGQFTPNQTIKKVVSPDAVLQANTSRANNASNIAKDFKVAGLNPDGSPSGDIDKMATLIAEGKVPPLQGFALANPRGQRIMARVQDINPDYDYTTVMAKKKAATDFGSGQLGNALRSVSTANVHLDQLAGLVGALDNGDAQLVNKLRNQYQTATGKTAPTDFDAIKHIVGQEVVKAIVAGGGSAGERDEAGKIFSNAGSKAQLLSAIKQYRMVMGAQADNLMEQRRAAGLPDSTLPKYDNAHKASSTQSSLPADVAAALAKHGSK